MNVHVRILRTQKDGNSQDEYEDAYRPMVEGEHDGYRFRAAMADGASEGYLSGQWADILVQEYCDEHRESLDFALLIEQAQAQWDGFLEDYIKEREEENRPIQWYEEPGLENGAFSTLIGLSIFDGLDPKEKTWAAFAIGDTCLFQIRRDELIRCFPLDRAELFNNWPGLIASNPKQNKNLIDNRQSMVGNWEDGDRFFLMSDAISSWFLKECEANHSPLSTLRQLASQGNENFIGWVQELREKDEMRNDDVTLMSILLSER